MTISFSSFIEVTVSTYFNKGLILKSTSTYGTWQLLLEYVSVIFGGICRMWIVEKWPENQP